MKKLALQIAKQIVSDNKQFISGNIADYMIEDVGQCMESFFEYLTEEEITAVESDTIAWNKHSNDVTTMLRENFDYDNVIEMTNLEVLETRRDELVRLTLDLMPIALSGDRANRTFYFEFNEDGELVVNYLYYAGQQYLTDNCFYTICDHNSVDASDFGYEHIGDMDFEACGFSDQIKYSIDNHIALLGAREN